MIDEILSQLQHDPERVAIQHGGARISARELLGAVDDVTDEIRSRTRDVRAIVGVTGFESWRWIAGLVAIWRTGHIYAPYPVVVAADDPFAPTWMLDARTLVIASHRDHAPVPAASDTGYLFPTSGSTGAPKWVLGSRSGLERFIRWEVTRLCVTRRDRVSNLTAPTFDPVFRDVLVPLLAGATLCIPPARCAVVDGEAMFGWLAAERVSIVHCVPTLVRAWLARAAEPVALPDLRALLLAGEPLFSSDVRRWRDRVRSRARLFNLYGPTETVLAQLCHEITDDDADADERAIPVGRPLPGTAAIVLDDNHVPCEPYRQGQVYIRVPYACDGYWQQPELTAERFIPNPLAKHDRLQVYRTGDTGFHRDDNELVITGRIDHEYKVRGTRVDLSRIEDGLRSVRGVRDAAVKVVQPRERPAFLCAFIAGDVDLETVRRDAIDRIPRSAWPTAWQRLDELPRTTSGKLDRARLPDPEQLPRAPEHTIVDAVRQIWRDVLPSRDIPETASFRELGGQSIEAVQIAMLVEDRLGCRLSLEELFRLDSVELLAARIDELRREARDVSRLPRLEPTHHQTALPLTGAQLRFWNWLERGADPLRFQFVWAALLEGPVDHERLRAACDATLSRHPGLAPQFRPGPLQQPRVAPANVSVTHWQGALDELRLAALTESAVVFEHGRGSLARIRIYVLSDARCVFVLDNHILVSDGWTKSLLLREITERYAGTFIEQPQALTFLDYAAWELACAPHERRHDAFWGEQLARLHRPKLPYVEPRERWLHGPVTTMRRLLDEPVTRALARRAGDESVSVASIHLAALTRALADRFGEASGHVLLSNAKRTLPALNNVVGCFTDSTVFPYAVTSTSFREHAAATHELCGACLRHDGTSFESLLARLRPDIDRCDETWFPVIFAPQPAQDSAFELPDARVTPLPWSFERWIWPVEVYPIITPDRTELVLNYASLAFAESQIAELFERMASLLVGYARGFDAM